MMTEPEKLRAIYNGKPSIIETIADPEDGWIMVADPEEGSAVTFGRTEAVALLGVLKRFLRTR